MTSVVIRFLVLATSGYFGYLEWLQILDKTNTYFKEITNYIQLASVALNITLILKNDFFNNKWYSTDTQKEFAALAILFQWYNVFYWMRLFDSTAFFINLLESTMVSILAFVKMMIILILGVSNIVFILNLDSNIGQMNDVSIFSEHLSNNVANSVIFTYLLSLGEFDFENFTGDHQAVMWCIFLVATFLL